MTTFLHILLLLVDIVATAWILFEIIPNVISDRIVGIPSFIISVILSICINIYIYIHGYYDLFIFFGIFMFIYVLLYRKLDLEDHPIITIFINVVLGIVFFLLSYLSTKAFLSEASALTTLGLLFWWVVCVHMLVPFLMSQIVSKGASAKVERITYFVLQFIGICIVVWFISDIINGQLSI